MNWRSIAFLVIILPISIVITAIARHSGSLVEYDMYCRSHIAHIDLNQYPNSFQTKNLHLQLGDILRIDSQDYGSYSGGYNHYSSNVINSVAVNCKKDDKVVQGFLVPLGDPVESKNSITSRTMQSYFFLVSAVGEFNLELIDLENGKQVNSRTPRVYSVEIK